MRVIQQSAVVVVVSSGLMRGFTVSLNKIRLQILCEERKRQIWFSRGSNSTSSSGSIHMFHACA